MARFIKMPRIGGPFNVPLRVIQRQLPPMNFITVHYSYFIFTCLISAVIFWGSSTPFRSVSFTDSLFLTVSAMTLAGLNTVNLSTLNTFQQFLLFLLIMLGSAIWVSAFVVHVRKNAFEKKFKDVIEAQRQRMAKARGRSRSLSRRGTWGLSRRSTDIPRDEEHGQTQDQIHEEKHDNSESSGSGEDERARAQTPYSNLDGTDERDLTPEGRRGGPEMNRVASTLSDAESEHPANAPGIKFAGNTRFGPSGQPQPVRKRRSSLFTLQGVGARPRTSLDAFSPVRDPASYGAAFPRTATDPPHPKSKGDISDYFESVGGWISRNSQFHGLSEKEREKLGGCEYRAISLLAWLVPVYFVLWQLLGCLGCGAWVAANMPGTARRNGLDPFWVGAFNAVSAFNNSGMSLLDANMVAFQRSYYMLITMSLLILAGNTAYPIFLRLIIWCLWRLVKHPYFAGPEWEQRERTLRFLLDHPRRCYTNLFQSQHTWWLLFSLIMLNGIDWAAFEILNINNSALNDTVPTNIRVIDGLFQAFAVRSGGFYVVSIPSLRISLQVLYVVMMYISVYPVVITMRNSNVYEERSLGIYAEDDDDDEEKKTKEKASGEGNSDGAGFFLRRARTLRSHLVTGGAAMHESNGHFVRQQLRAQLAHDAWWIVLALFLIMIIENQNFVNNPVVFSVFNFIFEIVSAYGCVGISIGVPWAAYSFCGSWHTLSKLILCAVMLRGRHRGLPVAIDKAVLLPGEEISAAEEEDGRIRMARTMSRGRTDGGDFLA